MTLRILLTLLILTRMPAFSQKTVLFVLDTLPTPDSAFDNALSRHPFEFRRGTIHDLTTHNFRVLDSLSTTDKNWFKRLDNSLSTYDRWQKIKQQNTGKQVIKKNNQNTAIVFWEFGRLKHYRIDDWAGAEDRHVLTTSGDYTRDGKKKK